MDAVVLVAAASLPVAIVGTVIPVFLLLAEPPPSTKPVEKPCLSAESTAVKDREDAPLQNSSPELSLDTKNAESICLAASLQSQEGQSKLRAGVSRATEKHLNCDETGTGLSIFEEEVSKSGSNGQLVRESRVPGLAGGQGLGASGPVSVEDVGYPTKWLRYFLLYPLACLLIAAVGLLAASVGVYCTECPPPFRREQLLPARCKVLSKDVDLRQALVCGSGHAPVAGQRVAEIHPCSFEYYWTAVFQVEYLAQSAYTVTQTTAEQPNSLLPERCRPGFSTAWQAKESYRINASYPCTYSSHNPKQVMLQQQRVMQQHGPECKGEKGSPTLADWFHRLLFFLIYSRRSFVGRKALPLTVSFTGGIFLGSTIAFLLCWRANGLARRFLQQAKQQFESRQRKWSLSPEEDKHHMAIIQARIQLSSVLMLTTLAFLFLALLHERSFLRALSPSLAKSRVYRSLNKQN